MLHLLLLLTTPDCAYTELKTDIERTRQRFHTSYIAADSTERRQLVDSARTYLFDRITLEMLPCWEGTAWDFNGTTRTPGTGTIACGYFVNTVLQDAGFRIPRIRWSQQAAEPITVKLCTDIKRFRDRPVQEVEAYIKDQGEGLYKVGLDNHVGFIVNRGGTTRFVHSNYYRPEVGVMSEPLQGHNPLARSHYRVVGKLLNDRMVVDWIMGKDHSKDP